jgi:hypothetical protein
MEPCVQYSNNLYVSKIYLSNLDQTWVSFQCFHKINESHYVNKKVLENLYENSTRWSDRIYIIHCLRSGNLIKQKLDFFISLFRGFICLYFQFRDKDYVVWHTINNFVYIFGHCGDNSRALYPSILFVSFIFPYSFWIPITGFLYQHLF